jgi:hypothetical protein
MDDPTGWPQLLTSAAAEQFVQAHTEETLLSPVKGNSIKPGVTSGNPWTTPLKDS